LSIHPLPRVWGVDVLDLHQSEMTPDQLHFILPRCSECLSFHGVVTIAATNIVRIGQ
jgi:hypothetical protein